MSSIVKYFEILDSVTKSSTNSFNQEWKLILNFLREAGLEFKLHLFINKYHLTPDDKFRIVISGAGNLLESRSF